MQAAINKQLEDKVSTICAYAERVVTSRDELTQKLREALAEVPEDQRGQAWLHVNDVMHSDPHFEEWTEIDRACWDDVHP